MKTIISMLIICSLAVSLVSAVDFQESNFDENSLRNQIFEYSLGNNIQGIGGLLWRMLSIIINENARANYWEAEAEYWQNKLREGGSSSSTTVQIVKVVQVQECNDVEYSPCDLNKDGELNLLDISEEGKCHPAFNNESIAPGKCDLDGDGDFDDSDWSIWAGCKPTREQLGFPTRD